MKKSIFIFLLLVMLLVQCAYAVPTTQAAFNVNSINVTFNATGASGNTWWEYGTRSGELSWKTENTSAVGGYANITESGVPLMAGLKFYFRACDSTGCGSELDVTLTAVTPAPTTTFGSTARNISRSHFDLAQIGTSILEPYVWVTGNAQILMGVLLFFVFTGLWLRQREVILPIILGMILSGLLIYNGASGGAVSGSIGIPPEMLMIVIGLVAAGLTGVIVGLLKR